MDISHGYSGTSGGSNMVGRITVEKKKKKRFAGGSITDEVRKATGIGGETTTQKRERFLKSEKRDPKAKPGSEQFETELRTAKGLKPTGEKEQIEEAELIKARETIARIENTDAEKPNLIKFTSTSPDDPEGVVRTFEMTPEQAALFTQQNVNQDLQAKIEGRVPFNDLPIYQQILAETAVLGVSPKAITSVGKLGQIGKRGVKPIITNAADAFATNPKSSVQTIKWLGGLVASVAAAFLIKDMVGTYPMAGFLKEEALQTLGFAFKSAKDSANIDGMTAALELQQEVLNPTLWDKILFAIPYLNVHVQNKAFFEAARVKMENDADALKEIIEE